MQVSVVMASFNPTEDSLRLAIESVLCQTFRDFEFIIVDDGSSCPLEPVVRSISMDERISVFRVKNSGLGAALNYGISKSCGEYIARLDDDDMMLPERLQKQVKYMDEHPDVSCVGTWHYDKYGNRFYPHRKFPIEHDLIVKSLLRFRFALAHTTLMFTRTAFNQIGGYRILGGGQDLDLELQLGTVGKLANLPEYLNYYTMSANGLGTVNPKKYEAYIFALRDIVNRNLFPEYRTFAIDSIRTLEHIDTSKMKSVREKVIRYLLILRVILFGEKMP